MNKRTVLSISVGLLTAACLWACSPPPPSTTAAVCTASSPKKDVTIKYGDGELSVDIKEKKVNRDDFLVFKLKPDNQLGPNNLDYKTVTVTVAGKNVASDWIAESGSDAGSGGELLVCVPTDQAYGTYEYLIQVDQVGTLDPRVVVDPS